MAWTVAAARGLVDQLLKVKDPVSADEGDAARALDALGVRPDAQKHLLADVAKALRGGR